ncbi:MAG: CoA ester lyase [Propionibacteriales bacterium]|nr:CoA ester lyase [Propionibacteriales bacterium]
MRALRSMLFTPGNRPELIEKAIRSGTDAVIVDLEDAVPLDSKVEARAGLADLPSSDIPLYVRVNGAETDLLWGDVVAAGRQPDVAGIVLPKAEDADLLRRIAGALTALELAGDREPGGTEIVPLIESARGVRDADALLAADDRVGSVLFGSGEQGDLVADLGCEWTPEGTGLLYARSQVLLAARAAGIEQPMDAVYMNFRDDDGLRTECELARRVGYVGKVAIHPRQIPVIHDVFTPSADEVAHNRRIVEEFERAVAAGSASINVDGKMVDYAVARTARTVLARAEAAERAGTQAASSGSA